MKKSVLWVGLVSLLSTATSTPFASQQLPGTPSDGIQLPTSQGTSTPSTQGTPTPSPQGIQTPSNQGTSVPAPKNDLGTPTPKPQGTPAPEALTNSTPSSQTTTPVTTSAAATAQMVDCNYHIPPETSKIDQTLIVKWAQKAIVQAFDFDHNSLDAQLSSLKTCFTEQGWQSFNDALQKSGNLNAIRSQQLVVSSMVNGTGSIVQLKDNQWKVSLPLQVVYQNSKEKLTQPLTVNLIIGRKKSGDLGIEQMIAAPRQAPSITPNS